MKQVHDQTLEESLQVGIERLGAADVISPPARTSGARTSRLISHPWQTGAMPGLIFLIGFGLRVFYINHESLDGDEAFSMTVSQLPLREMMRQLVEDFVHPP